MVETYALGVEDAQDLTIAQLNVRACEAELKAARLLLSQTLLEKQVKYGTVGWGLNLDQRLWVAPPQPPVPPPPAPTEAEAPSAVSPPVEGQELPPPSA